MSAGRYAPSPSGDLHFGNLRTAVLAWLFARQTDRACYLRIEDIDSERSSMDAAARQIADLEALGLTFDPPVTYQSDNHERYRAALDTLDVYECYCTRRDIREAASAPHTQPGIYPGTCRNLSEAQREVKRAELAEQGRMPALRLRAASAEWKVRDVYAGEVIGPIDDVILRRGGNLNQAQAGDWAYNLAVVVDDGEQGIDQIVRGDDLLFSAPAQAYLAHLLGYAQPEYVHVPLVVNAAGRRLAKRDGAVTLREMLREREIGEVVGQIAASLGCPGVEDVDGLLTHFDPGALPREPWVWED